LGYPDEENAVRARLERLSARTDAGVLVAVLDTAVAAVASYQLIEALERDRPQCRVTTLVVDERHRRKGLAGALLSAIEGIAVQHGCFRLEFTTRVDRADAADFYKALGFEERPRRLIKRLAGP
jgi:GNAT superfamily N-acetyltransferase